MIKNKIGIFQNQSLKLRTEIVRNFVFGVEDSLVSTVGLVSGIAVAGISVKTLILTGVILIFVEAFSMGVGSLLSENSADSYQEKIEVPLAHSIIAAMIMFFSYFVSGFLVLLPYILFPYRQAISSSVLISIVLLGILGAVSARMSKISVIHRSLTMITVGGFAIVIGIAVGKIIG